MRFGDYIRNSKGSYVRFYFWYALFLINEKTFRNRRWQHSLWDVIKCELFFVAGKCQHSGHCCKQVMIYQKGRKIDSIETLNQVKKRSTAYKRFTPVLDDNNKINHYSCSSLDKNNLCKCYNSRPSFCRTYPMSNFLQHDVIPKHCGYYIASKQIKPSIQHPLLIKWITTLKKKNRFF